MLKAHFTKDFAVSPLPFYLGLLHYLAFPYLIFFVGWLRPIFSVFFITILIIQLFLTTKLLLNNKKKFNLLIAPRWQWVLCLIILFCWSIYSGSGNFGYQNYDYMKHNAIYRELTEGSWPTSIISQNQKYYIVYYLAHYLLPALVGKLIGYLGLELTSLFQTFIGLVLIFFTLTSFIPTKKYLLLLISFMTWGGLDYIGSIFFKDSFTKWSELPEWWAGLSTFQYTGFTDLLFWVPQHAIGGWGATLLCLLATKHKLWMFIPSLISLGLLWSPLACIGLLPFLLISAWNIFKEKQIRLFLFNYNFYFSFLMLLIFYYFYESRFLIQPRAWQYIRLGPSVFLYKYIIFCILEFALILIPTFIHYYNCPKWMRQILLPMVVMLFVLPHLYFGFFSDIAMRSSIPMLLLCFIFFWKSNFIYYKQKKVRYLFWPYLIIASYSAFSDIHRGYRLKNHEIGYTKLTQSSDNPYFVQQYLGLPERFFFKVISKKS